MLTATHFYYPTTLSSSTGRILTVNIYSIQAFTEFGICGWFVSETKQFFAKNVGNRFSQVADSGQCCFTHTCRVGVVQPVAVAICGPAVVDHSVDGVFFQALCNCGGCIPGIHARSVSGSRCAPAAGPAQVKVRYNKQGVRRYRLGVRT